MSPTSSEVRAGVLHSERKKSEGAQPGRFIRVSPSGPTPDISIIARGTGTGAIPLNITFPVTGRSSDSYRLGHMAGVDDKAFVSLRSLRNVEAFLPALMSLPVSEREKRGCQSRPSIASSSLSISS